MGSIYTGSRLHFKYTPIHNLVLLFFSFFLFCLYKLGSPPRLLPSSSTIPFNNISLTSTATHIGQHLATTYQVTYLPVLFFCCATQTNRRQGHNFTRAQKCATSPKTTTSTPAAWTRGYTSSVPRSTGAANARVPEALTSATSCSPDSALSATVEKPSVPSTNVLFFLDLPENPHLVHNHTPTTMPNPDE